ncbi:hypothetical protein J2Z22_000950 [Paenibacillus forsythiae]|uniref:Copper amine oxidase-like N-terminal domain-containing protein n=1 Tax=Paenibacillus forsythiae TaxID=365616 RepID=A0ABU3H3P1_9BACL|nr:stalk domain-containing protein [Paenibacillus forsythiae]MDT3425434.1 hypothetical protein [Paenibacillus forsythiae]
MKLKPFLLSSILLAATSVFSLTKANAAVPAYGSVILNGESLSFEAKPILLNGNIMVTFRQIFEALDMNVEWD